MELEYFSGIGIHRNWNWNGIGIPIQIPIPIPIGIPIQNWKIGGKSAGPAGPAQTPKNRNFFGHSKMIGGLFRVENRVRSAPTNFFKSRPARTKNDN